MAKNIFPRGIELVGGVVIENKKGQILLTKSPKWKNKWVMPGGHVEPGEKLMDALIREGEEETGLKLRPVAIIYWGELINSKDFHRPAHFVFFDAYCKAVSGRVRLQEEELSDWKWLKPEDALGLDLAESYPELIKEFIAYRNSL